VARQFYFGTKEHAEYVKAPKIGNGADYEGRADSGVTESGYGYTSGSLASHRTYDLEWMGTSAELQRIRNFQQGKWGKGCVYFNDPYASNLFAPNWADPYLTTLGDWLPIYPLGTGEYQADEETQSVTNLATNPSGETAGSLTTVHTNLDLNPEATSSVSNWGTSVASGSVTLTRETSGMGDFPNFGRATVTSDATGAINIIRGESNNSARAAVTAATTYYLSAYGRPSYAGAETSIGATFYNAGGSTVGSFAFETPTPHAQGEVERRVLVIAAPATAVAVKVHFRDGSAGVKPAGATLDASGFMVTPYALLNYFSGERTVTPAFNKVPNHKLSADATGYSATPGTSGAANGARQTTGLGKFPNFYRVTWTTAPSDSNYGASAADGTGNRIPVIPLETYTFSGYGQPSWSTITALGVTFYDNSDVIVGSTVYGANAAQAANSLERRILTTAVPATAVWATIRYYRTSSGAGAHPSIGSTLDVAGFQANIGSVLTEYWSEWDDPDFTLDWSGTVGASTSRVRGYAVDFWPTSVLTNCVAIRSVRNVLSGTYSARVIPTNASSAAIYVRGQSFGGHNGLNSNKVYTVGISITLEAAQTGTLSSNARRVQFPKAGNESRFSNQAANAPGTTLLEITSDTISALWSQRILQVGNRIGGGHSWWNDLYTVEVPDADHPYTGGYFDGHSLLSEWTGADNASTSISWAPEILAGIGITSNILGATYTVAGEPDEAYYKHVLLIPPDETLYVGATGSATGTGKVTVRAYNRDGTTEDTDLTLLDPHGATRTNATFSGAPIAYVEIFLNGIGTVTLFDMVANLEGHYTGAPVDGQGHMGLRFVGAPPMSTVYGGATTAADRLLGMTATLREVREYQ